MELMKAVVVGIFHFVLIAITAVLVFPALVWVLFIVKYHQARNSRLADQLVTVSEKSKNSILS